MNKLKWNAGQIVNDNTSKYDLAQYPATDKPKYLVDYDFKDMEIARLNKIIDELEEYIQLKIIRSENESDYIIDEGDIKELYYKLKELKEEGKNE